MKYFLDTEFIEGFHKPLFGKKRHFIDLISIGIVGEDGSLFYAISNEYNYNDADDWVKQNVILPLYLETVHGDARNHLSVHNFHKHFGRSNKEIMCDIIMYIYRDAYSTWREWTVDFIEFAIKDGLYTEKPIEFYAYYADYDWVVFCSLFGRMINLPKNFPMYCKDLKQIYDDKNKFINNSTGKHEELKLWPTYPKQQNEHTALDDAKWNKTLYDFLQNI